MTDKPVRKCKGVWIPIKIWINEELSLQEKAFLAEIESLDNKDGCWASNAYFSKHFGISKDRCSKVITGLVRIGYLSISIIRNKTTKQVKKRILRVLNYYPTPIGESNHTPIGESNHTPIGENAYSNNTSINSTNKNIKTIGEVATQHAPSEDIKKTDLGNLNNPNKPPKKVPSKTQIKKAKRIILHLNKVAKKNLRFVDAHADHIYARFNEGYEYKDFIKVIDTKQHDPYFIANWTFMRPKTLFIKANFDNYLNEDPKDYKRSSYSNTPSNGSGYDPNSEYNSAKDTIRLKIDKTTQTFEEYEERKKEVKEEDKKAREAKFAGIMNTNNS